MLCLFFVEILDSGGDWKEVEFSAVSFGRVFIDFPGGSLSEQHFGLDIQISLRDTHMGRYRDIQKINNLYWAIL